MGREYIFGIGFGYEVSLEQLLQKYGKKLPEKFRKETTYHVRTGKKTVRRVIVREAGTYIKLGRYVLDPFNDWERSKRLLEEEFDCDVSLVVSDLSGAHNDSSLILFSSNKWRPLVAPTTESVDFGRATGFGCYTMATIADGIPFMNELGTRLRNLGFQIGEPVVRIIGLAD